MNGNNHPCVFLALDHGAISPTNQYYFWFSIFITRGSYNGFYLSFPVIIALIPWARKPSWGPFPSLNIHIPMMHFGTRIIITELVSRLQVSL